MPRALVTGGSGFIGSHLVRVLEHAGWQVRSLDLPSAPTDALEGCSVEQFAADITDPQSFGAAFKGVDTVFHLAALPRDWAPSRLIFRINRDGTRHVLEAAISAGCRRFVHMSSLAVHRYRKYFEADESAPRDANYPPYATSKVAAEKLIEHAAERGSIQTTIVRPGMVIYGPWDRLAFPPMIAAIKKGGFGYVNGGRGRICLSYVENLATGLLRAATSEAAINQTFVLADDGCATWREYVGLICELLNLPVPKLSVPYPVLVPVAALMHLGWHAVRSQAGPPLTLYRIKVASRDLHWSNAKARAAFGFEPTVGLREGLERTVTWYKRLYPGA